ncbi:LysR family transcriptional regulator [Psychromonas ossibalaenae]|uniref:LysR family transcriptional regulator n=1 Tax=Psychromonas ossibalaenae TaxID=444922 RepID=UPI0003A6394C|nr:LysR family transcriptional regulator [Psychromonas ossibalaenae]
MDLNLIKPFLAVYKYQSITKAADALDLTQPAISAALRRLEKRPNKKLFVKEGRGITATSSAIMLANKLEGAMELIETGLPKKKRSMPMPWKLHCSSSAPLAA